MLHIPYPVLRSPSRDANLAWQTAMGDIAGNIQPFRDGVLEQPEPCLLAGLVYDTPWTRDAAINTWNGLAFLAPAVARSTLRAVLTRQADGGLAIGGQYWDAIIWACGAWAYWQATGDRPFLVEALEAVSNSLRRFEREEFDAATGLFRGGSCFQDGLAAYGDRYADTADGNAGVEHWLPRDAAMRHPVGAGFPAQPLSTNALYYQGYVLAGRMAAALGVAADPAWSAKAAALGAAIERHLWDAARGQYRHYHDAWGGDDRQEGLGWSFAILFGLADAPRAAALARVAHRAAAGLPCLWPTFERYARLGAGCYGRHSGTVWPQVNAFWAEACLAAGDTAQFAAEFLGLAARAKRDGQFAEIYHPDTGLPYGGVQESAAPDYDLRSVWFVGRRQSWCATGFVRMVIHGLFGLRPEADGLRFQPACLPGWEGAEISLTGLPWRAHTLDLCMEGRGRRAVVSVDGRELGDGLLRPGAGRCVRIRWQD
jgi:glycogen debranching enzyme